MAVARGPGFSVSPPAALPYLARVATNLQSDRFDDIRACVFDAYGTLFDVAAAAERCRAALGDKADALAALWRDKQLQYTWLRGLMGEYAEFWRVTGDALDYAKLARHG